jgi:hypothetical protein
MSSFPPLSDSRARYPYGYTPSATGAGVGQPPFEPRPSLRTAINEALYDILEPPSTGDRRNLVAITSPDAGSLRTNGA